MSKSIGGWTVRESKKGLVEIKDAAGATRFFGDTKMALVYFAFTTAELDTVRDVVDRETAARQKAEARVVELTQDLAHEQCERDRMAAQLGASRTARKEAEQERDRLRDLLQMAHDWGDWLCPKCRWCSDERDIYATCTHPERKPADISVPPWLRYAGCMWFEHKDLAQAWREADAAQAGKEGSKPFYDHGSLVEPADWRDGNDPHDGKDTDADEA
jgi:hypothetical protein